MKAIWHGTISFGLVSIPVNLFSAINPHTYDFDLLHAQCHHKIHYQYWCEHCAKKVEWQAIVKGLKQNNGSYAVLTKEKLAQLKPGKTDTIDIIEFIDAKEINPLYLQNHYYLAPQKKSEQSFFLFKQALADTNKIAIGQFTMRTKDYICAITPYKNSFILNTLNYAYEIRDPKEIQELKKQPKINAEQLALAKELIAKLTKKTFTLSHFKDTFIERLKKAIAHAKKTKTTTAKKIKPSKKPQKERAHKEDTLMSMLQKSLKKKKIEHKPISRTAHAKKRG